MTGTLGGVMGGKGSAALWQPLRHRDFALVYLGGTISSVGDGIFTVALVLESLRVDHSPEGLALVLAARTVPAMLFLLAGGVVADRIPKRLAMLGSDTVRGMAVGTIALLVAAGRMNLEALIAMSVVFGVADAFFGPASMAMVPELLPEELVVAGNALGSTSGSFAQGLVGPATGGLVVGLVGTAGCFAVDAGSFAVSVVCLASMASRARPAAAAASALADARAGFAYLRSQPWLVANLVVASIANFVGLAPFAVLVPLLVRHVLHASAPDLGLVYASGGAAGIVASLAAARVGMPTRRIVVMWTLYTLGGLSGALLGAAPDVAVAALLYGGWIGFIAYGDILYVAMMQTMVPAELRGRVFSAAFLLAFVITPLGTVMGGAAAGLLGARTAILASGLCSAACGAIVFFPGARGPRRSPGAAGLASLVEGPPGYEAAS